MKRILSAFALFVASLFITAGIWAQSVKATVPFDFIIDNTTVPAGTYYISSASVDHAVLQISDQKRIHLLAAGMPDVANAGKGNVLVFHKYGNQYFLKEIRSTESASMNLCLPTWKSEKRAKAQTEVAGIPMSSDVLVALY